MVLERISVLNFKEPSEFTAKDVQTTLVNVYGIFNCVPCKSESNKWPETTCEILQFWIGKAKETWFYPIEGKRGLLFFRDDHGRIINVSALLIGLKLGGPESYMKANKEQQKLKILLSGWEELHELKIDYSEFLNPRVAAAIPHNQMDSTRRRGKKKRQKTATTTPEGYQIKRMRILEAEPSPDSNFELWVQDGCYIYEKEKLPIVQTVLALPVEDEIKSQISQDSCVYNLLAWSRWLKGGSMFLIESPTRDRNDVWVPILFQSVYNAIKTSDYQFGVSAVIITANRNSALSLKDFFDIRLNCRFTTQVATETLLDGLLLSEEQIKARLKSKILITTLPMLTLIAQKSPTTLSSAKFVVIQNIQDMSQKDELKAISHYFTPLNEKQVFVTSRMWKPIYGELLENMMRPTLCIASPIEVLLREKCEFTLKFINCVEEQLEHVIEIIKQSPTSRVGVICSEDLLGTLQAFLQNNLIPYTACGENANASNVFVMTDKQMGSFSIGRVDVLIHVTFPNSMVTFSNRFGVFQQQLMAKNGNIVNHLQLNMQNYKTFLKPLEFLYLREALSPQVVEICRKLKMKHDSLPENAIREFCTSLSIYGKCSEPFTCPFRHSMNENDVPEGLQTKLDNRVDLKIHSILDPNHYLAEIIRYGKDARDINRELASVKYGLGPYFMRAENRILKTSFAIGELCVFTDKGRYRRGRIVGISTSPRTKSIELQCLDTGNSFKLKQSDDIYDMPDLFKTCAQVVDVYLLGTAPIEPGSEWCWQSIKYVKDSFAIRSDDNFKVQAEIAVFMKNRIYLSSLKIVEILNKSRIHVRSFDLKEHLIAERFARHATEGLCLMTGMAEAFGLAEKAKKSLASSMSRIADLPPVTLPKVPDPTPLKIDEPITPMDTEELMDDTDNLKVSTEPVSNALLEFSEYSHQPDHYQQEDVNYAEDFSGEQWEDNYDDEFQYTRSAEEDDDDYDSEFDLEDNLDAEDVVILFKQMLNISAAPEMTPNSTSAIVEEISDEEMPEASSSGAQLKTPVLSNGLKYPEIKWSQTDEDIKLRMSLAQFSVTDHYVSVKDDYICHVLQFENGETRGGLINLFGSVDPAKVTVKLYGLVLTVTLVKDIRGLKFMWPRLMQTERPANWLKQYYKFHELENDTFLEGYEIYQVPYERDDSDEEIVDLLGSDM